MSKLLVVDDELHVRKLYQEVLSRDGHEVTAVATGEEAYAALESHTFDLVVLDIELENDSGLNILKQLKAAHPDLPVILNSAYTVYKADFHSWVADAYVLKSSDFKPLKDKINELVHA
ncbi:MAG: response regulator [candidate division Zixibacteria bacterium]|nr:response regulator [candidate division Zixibacteria bacterium]